MYVPGTILCDFCKSTIDGDVPFPSIELPLSQELRKRLQQALQKQAQTAMSATGIDAPQIIVPMQAVPAKFKLEICMGCVSGFFIGIEAILEEQILYHVNSKQAALEKQLKAGVVEE